ncbi:MAG: DUF1343 domain-containing protein [Myxococcales bacterium]|nr:DUF1343 domain-containing protein [Myxococcales bacterium]
MNVAHGPYRAGAELLHQDGWQSLLGHRVAVVCNPTSLVRTPTGRTHIVDAMRGAGVDVVQLFGPEHGVWATAQDMIGVDGGRDPIFGLPVRSLYGYDADSLVLRPETLDGVDRLVFDVQDIGARYYTYAATLCMTLEACAARNVPVVVLDRANPLGGERIEGNAVPERYRSFVGWIDIPQRHGLTVAEIAALYAAEAGLDVELQIVTCNGWQVGRYMDEQDTGGLLPAWTPPSPNMPTVETAVLYPGGCLVEATNLSEGRGTTRPFEVMGAPNLPARALAERIVELTGGGLHARPLRFEPTFQKWARQTCEGVILECTDRGALRSVRSGLAIIAATMTLCPEVFKWRAEAYEFVDEISAMDLLMGGSLARETLEQGGSLDEATADFAAAEARFVERVRPHLRYPRASGAFS